MGREISTTGETIKKEYKEYRYEAVPVSNHLIVKIQDNHIMGNDNSSNT